MKKELSAALIMLSFPILLAGGNLKNIYYAVDFLKNNTKRIKGSKFNYEDISAKGKMVVVIGGGDTGTDCVATALRQ